MKQAECYNCRFFFEGKVCRRYPPHVAVTKVKAHQITQTTIFPFMQPSGWCGEYSAVSETSGS